MRRRTAKKNRAGNMRKQGKGKIHSLGSEDVGGTSSRRHDTSRAPGAGGIATNKAGRKKSKREIAPSNGLGSENRRNLRE